MKKNLSLSPDQLCQKTDLRQLKFKTTDEVVGEIKFIGHSRAVEAVQFGVGIKKDGYNLYAMGPTGVGMRTVIYSTLEEKARRQKVPADWCYIHNFEQPQKPLAIKLPAGSAHELRRDMAMLVEDLSTSIPIMLESEEYRSRLQKITNTVNNRQEKLLKHIKIEAEEKGLIIVASPEEFTILPADQKGRAIDAENFVKLAKKTRAEKEELISHFTERLTGFLRRIPKLHKEQREQEKALKKKFTLLAVGHFVEGLKKKYSNIKAVLRYLDALQEDVIEHVQDFMKREESAAEKPSLSRYEVNVLVDHSKTQGAPIIYEENPCYANLLYRVEHIAQYGTLSTDFTLIKPSALHKANGGYLIMDAAKILQDPAAWDGLKRALHTRKITLETPEPVTGTLSTVSLEPMPIRLDVKIVLLGDRLLHYLLCESDPDFSCLFKVIVDFDEYVSRTSENLQLYVRLIATLVSNERLRPFDRAAVAAVIDYSARLAEDAGKLSVHMRCISEVICEADYWARQAKQDVVQAKHIKQAIDAKIRRLDRVRDAIYEDIARRIILIDLQGEKIGRINGLMVVQLGSFNFGHPCCITAQIRHGDGQVIDIQREIEMGGPIHSKGLLILSGFLAGRYAKDIAFSLSASLVFEQTYSVVDGDSASAAELCALLSAIAEVPLQQSLAVTGSINQYGEIQAIGSLNEKIEGFFDVCKASGLTGRQGVIIPIANLPHLMLKDEVVSAVENKKFHVYAVQHIDEVMTLLTGLPTGERDKNGQFTKGSLSQKIADRLIAFSQIQDQEYKAKHRKKAR
jgi:lon-related putative ATP-dependent protease